MPGQSAFCADNTDDLHQKQFCLLESQKQSENASHEEESEEKESKKDNVKDAEFEEK